MSYIRYFQGVSGNRYLIDLDKSDRIGGCGGFANPAMHLNVINFQMLSNQIDIIRSLTTP